MRRRWLAGLLSLGAPSALVLGLSAPFMLAAQAAWAGQTGQAAAETAAPRAPTSLKDREIAYVLVNEYWAVYETPDGKEECPQGLNDGAREQFKQLFPENGTKYTLRDSAMAREAATWFPTTDKDQFEFREASGKYAYGLNLDGKMTGPNKFTGPDGETGVDDQLYRVIGCISNYRKNGTLNIFTNQYMQEKNYNRVVVDLTNVDSLTNDDDVAVSIYRGMNRLLPDGTGSDYAPGGSQRLDFKWGKQFISHTHGRIVNGVLTTDPMDVVLPAKQTSPDTTVHVIKGMRLRLNLTPESAKGVLAGYTDVDAFYRQMIGSWSTLILSYGQLSPPSVYKALHRLADGYPDPKTGENTAISSAINVDFRQVFIVRDGKELQPPSQHVTAATQQDLRCRYFGDCGRTFANVAAAGRQATVSAH